MIYLQHELRPGHQRHKGSSGRSLPTPPAGQQSQDRARLEQGMDLAHRCVAETLLARAIQELELAGARPGEPRCGAAMRLRPPSSAPRDGRDGDDQQGDRPGPVRHAASGRDAPHERLWEARDHIAARPGAGARRIGSSPRGLGRESPRRLTQRMTAPESATRRWPRSAGRAGVPRSPDNTPLRTRCGPGRDRCSCTKPAVSSRSTEAPLAIQLDDREALRPRQAALSLRFVFVTARSTISTISSSRSRPRAVTKRQKYGDLQEKRPEQDSNLRPTP